MAKDNMNGMMEENIKDNFSRISFLVKEFLNGKMVENIQVNLKMGKSMEKVNFFIIMVGFMMESFQKENNMELEYSQMNHMKIKLNKERANGKMEKERNGQKKNR